MVRCGNFHRAIQNYEWWAHVSSIFTFHQDLRYFSTCFNLVSVRRKDNLWTFHRCRHQWLLDSGSKPTFMGHKATFWTGGTLTTLFTLDQCPFALTAQHSWAELLCKGLYFSIMQGLTVWKLWGTLDSEIISTLHVDANAQYQSHFGTGTVFIYRLLHVSCATFEGTKDETVDFSFQVGWHLWDHFEQISKTGAGSKPTFGLGPQLFCGVCMKICSFDTCVSQCPCVPLWKRATWRCDLTLNLQAWVVHFGFDHI
jgi:hypothetical protein